MLNWNEIYHIVIVDMQDFLAASTPFLPLANFKEDLLYTHALLHAYIYSNYFSISCIQMYIQAWNIWIRIGEVEKLRFFSHFDFFFQWKTAWYIWGIICFWNMYGLFRLHAN